jgi:hypothetical protein
VNQQQGEVMAGQDGSRTWLHYGVKQAGPDGKPVYADYYSDKVSAAQGATMTGCELVTSEVTYGPWVVIPNPLLGDDPR